MVTAQTTSPWLSELIWRAWRGIPGPMSASGGNGTGCICPSALTWNEYALPSHAVKDQGKGFTYSTSSVGPGADPGVQAVRLQVTISHPPGGRLPLLSARPAVTFPAAEHHRPLAGTKLYCLVTEAHRCKQLA